MYVVIEYLYFGEERDLFPTSRGVIAVDYDDAVYPFDNVGNPNNEVVEAFSKFR